MKRVLLILLIMVLLAAAAFALNSFGVISIPFLNSSPSPSPSATPAPTGDASFIPVTNISGIPETAAMGTALELTGTVEPSDATHQRTQWSVKDAGTTGATIQGHILHTTAEGTVTITATIANGTAKDTGYTQDFTITVTASAISVTGVKLKTSITLAVGNSETLSPAIRPSNATNEKTTWSSSDPSIATAKAGLVTAVSAGTAVITVKTEDGGFTASCTVTVPPLSVTGITLNKTSATIEVNGKEKLTVSITPSDATNQAVIWSSSDPGVAVVDNTGNVTAVSAGTATITAMTAEGNKTAACEVTVT